MKITHSSILSLTLLLCIIPKAMSDEVNTPHITVYGTATIQATPNQMIWLLNARNNELSSNGAAAAHEKMVAEVLSFLKQNEIPQEKVQTSRMQLGENWKYVRNERVQDGYFASTDIQFTLSDLSKYASVWSGLSFIAGVQIGNVSLDTSERIKFQNEARTKAVIAARDKANAIAETLGLRIGQPLTVEEDLSVVEGYRAQIQSLPTTSNVIMSNEVRTAASPIDSGPSVAPGSISIRSRVRATFELPKK